ncbi:PREDICTED: dedicator of cytokinesis protein 1-like [Priapulus caudatus]|uniref:Dedicator of cytokinesis protein 1-like n=1 Tax=Priapulus caudatus TaxID=37621 RepID=A0ABM1DNE6_PRICU|nr:PREDICTED: dedicator of cytokinesis protein 1-like [Priapulus caudatus]
MRPDPEKRNSAHLTTHLKQLHRMSQASTSSTGSLDRSTPSSGDFSDEPPPLPQKLAQADYTNIVDTGQLLGPKNTRSMLHTRVKDKPPPPLPEDEDIPPTPPKKPMRPATKDEPANGSPDDGTAV